MRRILVTSNVNVKKTDEKHSKADQDPLIFDGRIAGVVIASICCHFRQFFFGARAKLEANSAVNEELAFHRQI